MKNKIKQFAKGNFVLPKPDIIFPETHLQISVSEGEIYQGSFYIENQKDGNIRGLVYPSSFRMHCLEQGFDSNPVKVNFMYDSTGLVPGHTEQGKFTVVCNGGEYDITYAIVIEKPFIMTSYGKIQTLSDFKKLAVKDFGEARRLFRSRQFYDVLKYEDVRIKNLYDNVRKWSLDELALEEFLVGIKLKEKIYLTINDDITEHTVKDEIEYKNIFEDKKGSFEIVKNTWGYLPIKIDIQDDFIKIRQKEISTEDFIGNSFRLEYVIQKEKLHAGYNFGRIKVETPYETLVVEIRVHQCVSRNDMKSMKGLIAGQGLKEYLACISGKMELNAWVESAISHVKKLEELSKDDEYFKEFYTLLKAHIYLRGRREEEAKWILENGEVGKFSVAKNAEITAYQMFLNAMIKKDSANTNRVLDELNRMYIRLPYSWQILCMIINLEPKYRNYSDRIRVLERQFHSDSQQILLYAEAYICFQEKVPLLRKLDSFEIQILNFATKYRMITKELALHAADLISQQKGYNKKLVEILKRSYAMYQEPRILNALCMQLIKGNKIGPEYFKWYEKAVEQELKIAQLFEYYMMSVNMNRVRSAFPRIVYLYFLHGINLDYKRTALLYENILTYEDENSDIYKSYQEQIKEFAVEQLKKRHINNSLRIIYNRFINEDEISLEELEALYDICHKYHVTTDNKWMKYLLVIEKDGSVQQRVAYTEQGANVYLYTKDSYIVWEGKDGHYYIGGIQYDVVRLFYEMRYMDMCNKRLEKCLETEYNSTKIQLNFENLKLYGFDAFNEDEIFFMCTRRIREQENVEDDFLLYISYELFKRGQYDKALLGYLSNYYCGATFEMKCLWKKAREYGVFTNSLAERIITQMLFSEVVFQEEEIFEDYYVGKPYFRLKQAYLAYVSRLYVVSERCLNQHIFAIIMKELTENEYLADICKVAILKYFAGKKVDQKSSEILLQYFHEMCEKRMIFAFYQDYPDEWLREVQMYDKYIIEYHASPESKVKVVYSIDDGEKITEILIPTYQNTYIKECILYTGETLHYFFIEENKDFLITTEMVHYTQKNKAVLDIKSKEFGKYGRLNTIISLPQEERLEAMLEFKREEELANRMFPIY